MATCTQDESDPLLTRDAPRQHISDVAKSDLVDFNPDGDTDDPQQWSKLFRWATTILLACTAFTVTFTCIGVVPVANSIIEDLEGKKQKSASVLLVTIWELGEAAGPLFISPLSEVYGRLRVMNACNVGFIGFTLLSSLADSADTIIAERFLTGMFVAVNVLNPAIIGDMFPSEERGTAMSLVMFAPLFGGAVGPALSGWLATSLGWRRMLWICAGLAATCETIFLLTFQETYKVTILNRRAKRLRKESGNPNLRTVFEAEAEGGKTRVWESVIRPFAILGSSTVLQLLSLFGSFVFAYFYIVSTTLPDIMQDIFGLTEIGSGFAFISVSAGSIISVLICNRFLDRVYIRLRSTWGKGTGRPEYRLPLCIFGGMLLPIALSLYGWATHAALPLMLFSVALLGGSIMLCFVTLISYVIDAFHVFSASAMTSVIVTRCLMGTFLPLATEPLVKSLGYGLAFTIWCAVAVSMAPIPVLVARYGAKLRQRSKYTRDVLM